MKLWKLQTELLAAGAATGCMALLFCIEQNNPWDPCKGCHPIVVLEMQNHFKNLIEEVTDSVSGFNDSLPAAWSGFRLQTDANSNRRSNNDAALRKLDSLRSLNGLVDARNKTYEDCDSAVFKNRLAPVTLFSLELISVDSFALSALDRAMERVDTLVKHAADTCPQQEVLTVGYVDTVNRFFSDLRGGWGTLLDSIGRYNARANGYNDSLNIDSIRGMVRREDSLAGCYNDSLEICRVAWIGDTTVIQDRIDSVKPGETIAFDLDSVRITDALFRGKGAAGKWIVIRGRPQVKTVISSARVEIDSSFNIKFA